MQTSDGIHEVFEGDVQYPYADVGAPELLHISKVTSQTRRAYYFTCPYCNKVLRPRLGSKKAHCYAHKPGESCELDRYIHTTAELLLKEKWNRDEPFEITMTVRTECKEKDSCIFYKDDCYDCVTEELKTFDLKKQYSQCIVEKKYGEFVPDLCLIDDTGHHEPIFIEIWNKHKNSEKKTQSGHRIIEIRIKTTEELEELPKHPITESETVTFSNFKVLKKTPQKDGGPLLMRYTLYATLKSYVDDETVFCGNYKTNHHAKSIFEVVCSQDEVHSTRQFRNYCNAIAIDRGYNIRSCYLCQHFGSDKQENEYGDYVPFNPDRPVGCRRDLEAQGLIQCKPEEAFTCKQFMLKDMHLKQLKRQYANINRYLWYRNPDGSVSEESQNRTDNWSYGYFSDFHNDFE